MSATVRRRHRALLALYPPSFRERYGAELRGLVEDWGHSRGLALDLGIGAARAWVRPRFGGPPQDRQRARLLASILTVSWSWSLVLLALAAFTRTVGDPPAAGLQQPLTHAAFETSQIAMGVATGFVLAGAITYLGAIALAAPRQRAVRWLLLAIFPPVATGAWLGATAALGWWLAPSATGRHPPLALAAALGLVLLAWLVASMALLPICSVSVATALRRAQLSLRWLRPGLVGAAAVAGVLTLGVLAMAVTVAALATSHGTAPTAARVLAGYCLVLLAWTIALASVARGMGSLREPGRSGPGACADPTPPQLSVT